MLGAAFEDWESEIRGDCNDTIRKCGRTYAGPCLAFRMAGFHTGRAVALQSVSVSR